MCQRMNSNSVKSVDSRTQKVETKKVKRWYWLDWLRVLAMGMIFLYHSGRPFVPFEWHIMNPEPDLLFTLFNVFVTGWIMPLFFVVSGMAIYFSLAKRSPGQFAKERFKRLIIPFIFALFVILPVLKYFYVLFQGYFTGSFIDFYFRGYFTSKLYYSSPTEQGYIKIFPFDFNLSPTYFAGSNQGIYLWYLFWLFIFSLITVHIFRWLRKEENRSKISKLAAVCNRLGGIFLMAIPLIIVEIVAIPPFFVFPSPYGGWKLPTYLAFFILAYMLASDSRFEQSIDKNGIPALVTGIVTSILIIIIFSVLGVEVLTILLYYILFSILWAFNGWCWVIAILSLGRKLLSFNHRFLKFSNELVLPFYILHETVIVVMAFYVIGLNLSVIVKYLMIVSASFAIISILLLPIKQINVLRFLFGMRLKKREST